MRDRSALDRFQRPGPCPACGGALRRIVYGLPDPELVRQARDAKVVLGGCIVSAEQPDWSCNQCGRDWRKSEVHGRDG